jgi:DNA-binding transcriptional LysR family regulator
MVQTGVGMTILPKHCIDTELKRGRLHASRSGGCKNPIYIVERTRYRTPARVQTVLDAFWKMKKE